MVYIKLLRIFIGLTKQTWKKYCDFIKSNQQDFVDICETELLPADRRPIPHPNPELNFNLPLDFGGIGPIYNKERYSRVSLYC